MHLLLIPITYPNPYNRQTHVFFEEQALALSDAGISVGVLAVVPVSLKQIWTSKKLKFGLNEEKKNDVRVFQFLFPAIPKLHRANAWLHTKLGKSLFKKYRTKYGSPDIVHVHVSFAGSVAIWINRTFNIPYIVTEHYTAFTEGDMPAWKAEAAKQVFMHSRRNIAVSHQFKSRLENDFQIKFSYIPNIVNTEFFVPHSNQAKHHPVRKFLNIGNLYLQKNQEMLIKAFSRAFKSRAEYKLVIAGSGCEEARLKKFVSNLGMQNQISFFGQANRIQVVTLMQESDCFVLSSRYETFGVVVIEAMSCGVPVIATRSGGPETIIIEDELGILCDIDETQLANALIDASKRSYDSEHIRKYAVDKFSSDRIAHQLKRLYTQVITT